MNQRMILVVLGACLLSAGLMTGCDKTQSPAAGSSGPPVIPVSHPVQRQVTDYVDFTGRLDAVNSVGIRARVTGYIVKTAFKEGATVKKDDLLFEIDSRPYKAQYDQAMGQVTLNDAQLKLARTTYERSLPLVAKGAVSQQELDQDKAAVDEAAARIKATQATLEVYKLNLEFCKVLSPIDGQVGRYYYTAGNLINQDSTLLTTVVSQDPMYAYFDMDEATLLRIKQAINDGKIKIAESGADVPILMGLQGQEGYPLQGTFNFINNVVNPSTGSIAVRGQFANPKPEHGTRLLVPGMFVRIRLPIGQPHPALLVIDRALGSDQGQKYVYVTDKDNKAQTRPVVTGALQEDGLRVIESGLNPDDWVVVGALQQVRPRLEIHPDPVSMPAPEARGKAPPKEKAADKPKTDKQ
jgi:RND family efflux transporter MFP subunit